MQSTEINPNAKLTKAAVLEVRAAAANGESHLAIAARYGVTTPCIWQVVRRKSWKHIA